MSLQTALRHDALCNHDEYHKHPGSSRHHATWGTLIVTVIFELAWPPATLVMLLVARNCTWKLRGSAWLVLCPYLVQMLSVIFWLLRLQVMVFISFELCEIFRFFDWLDKNQTKENHKQHDMLCSFLMETMIDNDGNTNLRSTILGVGGGCMESFSKRPCSCWNQGV